MAVITPFSCHPTTKLINISELPNYIHTRHYFIAFVGSWALSFVSKCTVVSLCGWRRASSFAIFVFLVLIANVLDLVGCHVLKLAVACLLIAVAYSLFAVVCFQLAVRCFLFEVDNFLFAVGLFLFEVDCF